jgi:hypothetical protein
VGRGSGGTEPRIERVIIALRGATGIDVNAAVRLRGLAGEGGSFGDEKIRGLAQRGMFRSAAWEAFSIKTSCSSGVEMLFFCIKHSKSHLKHQSLTHTLALIPTKHTRSQATTETTFKMHYSSILALAGATFAAAAPAVTTASADGTWTLQGFVRTCNDTANTCNYKFKVSDNKFGRVDACDFTDIADSTRKARWSSPSNLHCAANSPIYVNVGYDQPGNFFVVVPVNRETSLNAFFGYTAAELTDGKVVAPDHTSPSLVVGTWAKQKAAGAAVIGRDATTNLGAWTVEGLHRSTF